MSKYICPSKKKEMELRGNVIAINTKAQEEKKKSCLINETDFPQLAVKKDNKVEETNNMNQVDLFKKKTFLDVLEKNEKLENKISSEPSSIEEEYKSDKQLKYRKDPNKNGNYKVKNKLILDKERKYDKSGWMINDDWIFWYEQNNPNQFGF